VPRILKVDSEYGKVDLDFSGAVIENPAVDIELRLQYGWARIVLPRNAMVDYDGLSAGWKQPIYKSPRHSNPNGAHIRIIGAMTYGRLKIRHRRR
jgi:hypothetical protein